MRTKRDIVELRQIYTISQSVENRTLGAIGRSSYFMET